MRILLWEDLETRELASKILLQEEGVIVVPSETVYGLAGNAFSLKAVQQIFDIKGRPKDNPLICHISRIEQALELVQFTNDRQKEWFDLLQKTFWPGPLTFVLPKNPLAGNYAAQNFSTVALRMPSHPIFRQLLEYVQVPLAAPSANISGRPSGTWVEDIVAELSTRVPLILRDNPSEVGIESTVLDLSAAVPTILRPGKISVEDLSHILPADSRPVYSEPSLGGEKSPGLRYPHYQPHFSVFLYSEPPSEKTLLQPRKRAYIVRTVELQEYLCNYGETWLYQDAEALAKDLYHLLYALERQDVEELFIESYPEERGGRALMDRLTRIASEI